MISSNTYEEVYQILKHMNKTTVMKIPNNILNAIVKNRNSNFKTNIDKYNIFNQKNISSEALDLLCWITYNYWLNESEKKKIDKINYDFYIKSEEEKAKKYKTNNIFKNKVSQENNSLVQ